MRWISVCFKNNKKNINVPTHSQALAIILKKNYASK